MSRKLSRGRPTTTGEPTVCSCQTRATETPSITNTDGYRVAPPPCNAVMLWYGTRAGSPMMTLAADLTFRDFEEPLAMGQRYRLSLFHLVNDGKVAPARLDSIVRHIGAQLMYKRFVPVPFGSMYPGAQLLAADRVLV